GERGSGGGCLALGPAYHFGVVAPGRGGEGGGQLTFVRGPRTRRVLTVGNTGWGRCCAGQEQCCRHYLTHPKKMTKRHKVVLLLSILFDHAGWIRGLYNNPQPSGSANRRLYR